MMSTINSDTIYTIEALKKLGIGHETLRVLRAAGVQSKQLGKRDWYDGREIIDYLRKKPSSQSTKP